MQRRELVAILAGAAGAWPLATRAQQKTIPVIGFLNILLPDPEFLDAFRKGLAEGGYHESQNVLVEYRAAEGQYDQLPALAAELVHYPVDLIVTSGGSLSGLAAKAATGTIPIIVFSGGDPVKLGFAASLSHPGANITGVAQLIAAADAKRLEILHELVPGADPIAYLVNPAGADAERQANDMISAAHRLGIQLVMIKASVLPDVEAAFGTITQKRIRALYVGPDSFFYMVRDHLVGLSSRLALPTMYFFREFVKAGGLISYGTKLTDAYYWLGVYAGKVLKGAKPAGLPFIQLSEKIELVINLKTAQALGLTIPQSILIRADEVIE
jgi:putative ABC transport system substrate-binding protein